MFDLKRVVCGWGVDDFCWSFYLRWLSWVLESNWRCFGSIGGGRWWKSSYCLILLSWVDFVNVKVVLVGEWVYWVSIGIGCWKLWCLLFVMDVVNCDELELWVGFCFLEIVGVCWIWIMFCCFLVLVFLWVCNFKF